MWASGMHAAMQPSLDLWLRGYDGICIDDIVGESPHKDIAHELRRITRTTKVAAGSEARALHNLEMAMSAADREDSEYDAVWSSWKEIVTSGSAGSRASAATSAPTSTGQVCYQVYRLGDIGTLDCSPPQWAVNNNTPALAGWPLRPSYPTPAPMRHYCNLALRPGHIYVVADIRRSSSADMFAHDMARASAMRGRPQRALPTIGACSCRPQTVCGCLRAAAGCYSSL